MSSILRSRLACTRRALVAVVALLSLSLFTATGTAQAQAALAPVAVGSSAPDAMLRTLDGTAVSLKQVIGGRPALLQFWATWCSTCTELAPTIASVAEQFRGQLVVVGVAVAANQTPARVQQYVKKHSLPGVHLFDADGAARDAFGVPGTSYVVVLDRAGTVVYIGIGGTQNLDRAVRDALLP